MDGRVQAGERAGDSLADPRTDARKNGRASGGARGRAGACVFQNYRFCLFLSFDLRVFTHSEDNIGVVSLFLMSNGVENM